MKKTIVTFTVLVTLILICASEIPGGESEKWTRLRSMDCHNGSVGTIDLRNVLDAKPAGYIVKFQYTSIGILGTEFRLLSADNKRGSPYYYIDMDEDNIVYLSRFHTFKGPYTFELPKVYPDNEPTGVFVAVTDDGILTLAVEGEIIFTYHDPEPFPINFVLLKSKEFYYNCTELVSKNSEIENLNSKTDEQQPEISNSTSKLQQIKKTNKTESDIEILITELDIQRKEIAKLNAELEQKTTSSDAKIKELATELDKQREKFHEQQQIVASCRDFHRSLNLFLNNSNIET